MPPSSDPRRPGSRVSPGAFEREDESCTSVTPSRRLTVPGGVAVAGTNRSLTRHSPASSLPYSRDWLVLRSPPPRTELDARAQIRCMPSLPVSRRATRVASWGHRPESGRYDGPPSEEHPPPQPPHATPTCRATATEAGARCTYQRGDHRRHRPIWMHLPRSHAHRAAP